MEYYTEEEQKNRSFLNRELKKFISIEERKNIKIDNPNGLAWPHGTTEQYLNLLVKLRNVYEKTLIAIDNGIEFKKVNVKTPEDFEEFIDNNNLTYRAWKQLNRLTQNIEYTTEEIEVVQFTIDKPFFLLSEKLEKLGINLPNGIYKIKGIANILNELDETDLIVLKSYGYPDVVNTITEKKGKIIDSLFIDHEDEYDSNFQNDYTLFVEYCEYNSYDFEMTITITKLVKIIPTEINQIYKDDENNQCLINAFEQKYPKSTKIIKNLKNKFPDGVPHNKLREFANIANCNIILHDIFGDGFYKVKTDKSGIRNLRVINNIPNHLNPLPKSEITINEDEINNIKNIVMKKIRGNKITKLYTEDNVYIVATDQNDQINDFIRDTNFKKYSMPTSDTELTEFLEHGYIVYQSQSMHNFDSGEYAELDHIRSFAQFKKSNYYSGFPTKITKFQKTNKVMGEGYYQCKIKFPEGHPLEQIHSGRRIIPKPLIECLRKHGADIKITHGAWSFTNWDWEFPKEFVENKNYTVVSGLLGAAKNNCVYRMPGDKYWGEQVQTQLLMENKIHDVYYDRDDEELVIVPHKYKKYHTLHIAGYITSYAHTHLIDTYMELRSKNINVYKIIVDGIYIDEKDAYEIPGWRIKKMECIKYQSNTLYNTIDKRKWSNRKNNYPRVICAGGEGGAGKTTFFIGDKKLGIKPKVFDSVYVTNAHELLCDKTDAADSVQVVQSFRSTNPYKSGQHVHPAWIILDEAHRYLNILPEIIHLYPDSGIVVIIDCDDEGYPYQLGTIYPTRTEYNKYIKELGHENIKFDKWGKSKEENYINVKKSEYKKRGIKYYDCFDGKIDYNMFDDIIKFETDYRCKCPELKKLKNKLRKCKNIKEAINAISQLPKVTPTEIIENYKNNEFILTGRRSCKSCRKEMCNCKLEQSKNYLSYLTKKLFEKGLKKYRINKNFKNYRNGQIVYDKPNQHFDKRHAFTFHSIQGKTIEENIYIDLSNIFDYRSVYVAVSRARYISQLKWFC